MRGAQDLELFPRGLLTVLEWAAERLNHTWDCLGGLADRDWSPGPCGGLVNLLHVDLSPVKDYLQEGD